MGIFAFTSPGIRNPIWNLGFDEFQFMDSFTFAISAFMYPIAYAGMES